VVHWGGEEMVVWNYLEDLRMEAVEISGYKGQFFRVLQRTSQSQAAVMTLAPGMDAGPEEQHSGDQIIYIVEGESIVRVKHEERRVGPGTVVAIPAHTRHYVMKPGTVPLFFLTIYAPPVY
jgi:mannose-6-phosphate isomerase-like protein (cupin superfamily)